MKKDRSETALLCDVDERGVATLTLNRPKRSNAFNSELIELLIDRLEQLTYDPNIRLLVLRGNGRNFSAGADLGWMKDAAQKSKQENLADAHRLAHLLRCLDSFPHPTLAYVRGSAFGGALGLICCCDVAIAEPDSQFCLSEVKLGLIPATIGPYVCRAIGHRQASRYMLSAEIIDAQQARALGIVHQVTPFRQKEAVLHQLCDKILANSPAALTGVKSMLKTLYAKEIDEQTREYTSELIADIRATSEAKEGIAAFFEKRPPSWRK